MQKLDIVLGYGGVPSPVPVFCVWWEGASTRERLGGLWVGTEGELMGHGVGRLGEACKASWVMQLTNCEAGSLVAVFWVWAIVKGMEVCLGIRESSSYGNKRLRVVSAGEQGPSASTLSGSRNSETRSFIPRIESPRVRGEMQWVSRCREHAVPLRTVALADTLAKKLGC